MSEVKWPWFERTFAFDFPPEKMPDIVERLRGTPARIGAQVALLGDEIVKVKAGATWSIQENIGHLADLEPCWIGRLDDILAGEETMREADLTNQKTANANHNALSLAATCEAFRVQRDSFLSKLADVEPESFAKASIHPRLNKPMRVVDLAFFVAEHDDYHLARIAHLIANLGSDL